MTPNDLQVNSVRIHENRGEVHLHDDTSKKKCSVDTTDFWSAWNGFKKDLRDGKSTTLIGKDGKTSAKLTACIDDDKLDVQVLVSDIELGQNFKSIDNFVTAK